MMGTSAMHTASYMLMTSWLHTSIRRRSLKVIDHFFKSELGSIRGDPKFSLHARAMSPSKYIKAGVVDIKGYHRQTYPTNQWAKQTSGPFPFNFSQEHLSTQIGIMQWCMELCCYDMTIEASKLACYLIMPQEGRHCEAVFY